MSFEKKERMRQRYQKQLRHLRTREEEQQLDEARKARRQQRRGGRDQGDGDAEFEKIRRAEPALGRTPKAATFTPNAAELRGTIVWLGKGRARVLCALGERTAVLAPELALRQQTDVAVGDEVVLHERTGAEPLLAAVGPRRSELARQDPQNPNRRRVLAANVDVAVLVLTATQPRTGLIDRLLLALQGSGAELLVCVNKCDLDHDATAARAALQPYDLRGLPVVWTSATRGAGIDDLHQRLAGRCAAFVGHSGVGKSTLLNALDPDGARATSAVRERDQKGRHTTSASHLRALPCGTRLIDTPGVRAFGLWDGAGDAAMAFPDVLALSGHCRFRDCSHVHEPGCAVRAAVDEGRLEAARYAAFRRLGGGD
ncbi:MAG: ribosome small subunit-dependent GTPase A [Planctomycetota bacterium]